MGESSTIQNELTLLIADRVSLFSSGIQHMLYTAGNFVRIDVADTRKELLQYISAFTYDVVLIDIKLDNTDGVELLRQIRVRKPDQKVLFFGEWKNELFLQQCLILGFQGYIFKQTSLKELYRAIKSVAAGNDYFTKEVSSRLIRMATKPGLIQNLVNDKLNDRELEVLKRINKEYSNQEIADDLNVSLSMVKKYKASLLVKTKSRNSVGLVLFSIKSGLLSEISH